MDNHGLAILRRNYTFLVRNLDVELVSGYLFQQHILSSEDLEVLALPGYTKRRKVEILVYHMLSRRGPNAYYMFLDALREAEIDCGFIVDKLEHTIITPDELQNDTLDVHNSADPINMMELYAEAKRIKSFRGTQRYPNANIPTVVPEGTGQEDETDSPSSAAFLDNLPKDYFAVSLMETEASARCNLKPNRKNLYILHIAADSIQLIKVSDFMDTPSGQSHKTTAEWKFTVIRKYGNGTNQFSLEAGRNAKTGPGYFSFRTNEENTGELIQNAIKDKIARLRSNGQWAS